MYTFEEYKQEALGNEELHREYEAIQPEYDIIKAMISTRTTQGLTQAELAEKTGIRLTDIKKLENGTRNPSLNLLKKLADGMGSTLKIEFIPKMNKNQEDRKMSELRKELLQVEADRAAGKPGCTLDELDRYLDNILEE